jgi:hypothetical protein
VQATLSVLQGHHRSCHIHADFSPRCRPPLPSADPLANLAGPIPFQIRDGQTGRCVTPVTPYSPGQLPIFTIDCIGGETLWTYDAGTQLISHYMTGYTFAPQSTCSGSPMILSDVATSDDRIIGKFDSMHILKNNRYVLPTGGTAQEASSLVAVANGLNAFGFVSKAEEAFQCFDNVHVPGTFLQEHPATDTLTICEQLCLKLGDCNMVTYDSSNNCRLWSTPFNDGGNAKAAAIQTPDTTSCLARKDSGE